MSDGSVGEVEIQKIVQTPLVKQRHTEVHLP